MKSSALFQTRAPAVGNATPRAAAASQAHESAADFAAERISRAGAPPAPQHDQHRKGNAGSGHALDPITRRHLESGLSADFSTVRIHADDRAAAAADRLGAQAYTQGESIVFAGGEYRPDTASGMRLIAHEAVHVIQQRAGAEGPQLKPAAQAKPAAYTTVEEAEKALKQRYGVAGISSGGSTWSVAELNSVYDALAKLPAGDVVALKGVTLAREKTLTDAAKKPRDGEFFTSQSVSGEDVTNEAELRLADSAFSSTAQIEETVIHETGHAVSSKSRRDAFNKELKATATFNKSVEAQNLTDSELTAAADAMNPVVEESNAAATEYNDLVKQRAKAKTKADKDDLDAKLKDAKKKYAEVGARLSPLTSAHSKAKTADASALSAKQTAETAKDAAKAKADATLAPSGKTKRIQNFVDFVTDKGIDPITQYAKDNWPGNPDEFYADAYALFLTDPASLKAKSSALFDWFKQGKYK